MEIAILIFCILNFIGLVLNLLLSITLINAFYRFLSTKPVELKAQREQQLLDLPMRPYNYSDAMNSVRISDDIRLTKDV